MATITISTNTGATYSGVSSTCMREGNATTNYYLDSSQQYFYLASSSNTNNRGYILIRFDGLSNLTPGGTVTNARIRLYSNRLYDDPATTVAYALLKSFDKAQATWNNKSTGVTWQAGGANGALDAGTTVLATGPVITVHNQGFVELTGAGLAAYIENSINNNSSDYGLVLRNDDDTAPDYEATSYEPPWGPDSFRPAIIFDYVAGANTQAIATTLADVFLAVSQKANHSQTLASTLSGVAVAVAQSLRHNQTLATTLEGVRVVISQIGAPSTEIGAVGKPNSRKHKFIVERDGKLLIFHNKQDAINALNKTIKSAQTVEVNEPVEARVLDVEINQPQPISPVLYDINAMLNELQNNAKAQALINQKNYEQFIKSYDRWIDDQDVELLLLGL